MSRPYSSSGKQHAPTLHGGADLGGVRELLEAHDEAAANDEVVRHPDGDRLSGGLVGGGVAGQGDHVLAVHDAGAVVGGPAARRPPVASTAGTNGNTRRSS
ncbi:hypothetical protein J7F03_21440 [Streptomyces sp. ISL-43]|nr:hypothetical protein [Streptomyces sp. ISL-43]